MTIHFAADGAQKTLNKQACVTNEKLGPCQHVGESPEAYGIPVIQIAYFLDTGVN